MKTDSTLQAVKDEQYALRSILNDAKVVYLHEDSKEAFELIYEGERAVAKYYTTPFNIINLYDYREASLPTSATQSLLNSIMVKLGRKLLILNQGLESTEERHNIYKFLSAYYYEWLDFLHGKEDFEDLDFDAIVADYLKVLDTQRTYDILADDLITTKRVEFLGVFSNLPVKKRQQMSREIQNMKKSNASKYSTFKTVNSMMKGGLLVNGETVEKMNKKVGAKKRHTVLKDSIKTACRIFAPLSIRQVERILKEEKDIISKHNKATYGSNSSATAKKVYDLTKTDVPEWSKSKDGKKVAKKLKPFAEALKSGFTYTGELLEVDDDIKMNTGVDDSALLEAFASAGKYEWDINEPLDEYDTNPITDDQWRNILNPMGGVLELIHDLTILKAKDMIEEGFNRIEVTDECIEIGLVNIEKLY